MKSAIRQTPRHVRAHSANTNETDVHILISVGRRSAEPPRYPCATLARQSLALPAPYSNSSHKKRIVRLLLSHCCHRTMTGTDDGLVGQRQNFFHIVFQRLFERNISAAHRAGKN